MSRQESIRILALGDSYTFGTGVRPEESWPKQLAERLRAEGLPCEPPQIIARTGWTTGELAAAIAEAGLSGPFDLVTLLIGVNNQYRSLSAADYRTGFRQLLDRAVALAGGQAGWVIVLSIPDWGVTPFAEGRDRGQIAEQIDLFNQINWAEATSAGAAYVDITPVSRLAQLDWDFLAEDGLHPSEKMYAAWVEYVLPTVKKILEQVPGKRS